MSDDPARGPGRAPDRVPRAARASRHARAGALLPRAARAGDRGGRGAPRCATRRRARACSARCPPTGGPRPCSAPTSTASCSRRDDVVVVLGQDGLVANVAKYLDGQPVIGLNPEPERFPGVLVATAPERWPTCARTSAAGRAASRSARWCAARLDDGQELRAFNEVFLGHGTHQSARYELIAVGERARAPVLVRADRGDRDRRDRLGAEHQPPVRRARAAGARAADARVVRARAVGEPGHRRVADRGPARGRRDAHGHERDRGRASCSATASRPTTSRSTGVSA